MLAHQVIVNAAQMSRALVLMELQAATYDRVSAHVGAVGGDRTFAVVIKAPSLTQLDAAVGHFRQAVGRRQAYVKEGPVGRRR